MEETQGGREVNAPATPLQRPKSANSLERYIESVGISPIAAMNALQNFGVISDNCVTPDEVGDVGAAISWLNLNFPPDE
jgi:hypothetical protein